MGVVYVYIRINIIHFTPHSLAKYICYDDACHLKRYALHPERAHQSKTAEKLASLA